MSEYQVAILVCVALLVGLAGGFGLGYAFARRRYRDENDIPTEHLTTWWHEGEPVRIKVWVKPNTDPVGTVRWHQGGDSW